MLNVHTFTFNPFSENTYLISDEQKQAVVIDPGCSDENERQELTDYIAANGLTVVDLVNTHCHIDHVLGNQFIKETYSVGLAIPEGEQEGLASVPLYAGMYGFPGYQPAEADRLLKEGETLKVGDYELSILLVPGHSAGHVAFYSKEFGFCINGDVLFRGSIGRTDLPGGDFDTLIRSIHEQMFALPDDTTVYCGHGPTTTIGFEKVNNPFCAIKK